MECYIAIYFTFNIGLLIGLQREQNTNFCESMWCILLGLPLVLKSLIKKLWH